ncbi:hypothetical protein ACSX1A_15110 [Pontibacter sp. MBLB2868]|uniref:hypothetical protein n=1 Tax=Pontibacter sp. MBLB2868 TaxID=3451555 RepID=UPI003F754B99
MKKLMFMMFAASIFTLGSCNSPADEAEDVADEVEDVAEEKQELNEEVQEYNEEVAEDMDTTTVVE